MKSAFADFILVAARKALLTVTHGAVPEEPATGDKLIPFIAPSTEVIRVAGASLPPKRSHGPVSRPTPRVTFRRRPGPA